MSEAESILSTSATTEFAESTPTTVGTTLSISWSALPTTTESSYPESTSSYSTVVVITQTQTDSSTSGTSTSRTTSLSPTSSTTENTSNATNTPSQAKSTGLSVGASAGIGVGVALGVLLLALAAFILYRYKRKRRAVAQEDGGRKIAYPELPELGIDGQKYELSAEESGTPVELADDTPKSRQTRTDTHELE